MSFPSVVLPLPLADALSGSVIGPVAILVLCVIAGLGTVLLLPGRRETSLRAVGGVILGAIGLIFVGLLVKFGADHGGGMDVYFWALAGIAIIGAMRVVTHPRPVYSALYFVLTIFASAGLFILLDAEFLAAALVLIYAGAILITYLFVIMLAASSTSTRAADMVAEYDAVSREPVAAAAVGFAMMGVLLFVIFDKSTALAHAPIANNGPPSAVVVQGSTQNLGLYLFQHQIVNVQLSGLLLTLGMVGAILIARRKVASQETGQIMPELIETPNTPVDDNPHSIPVVGTENPRAKAYPET